MEKPTSPAPAQSGEPSASSGISQEHKDLYLSSPTDKLTLKQRRFVEVTAKTLNPTEAATQVYDVKGNRETAHAIAAQNLRKLPIKKAVERALSTNKQDRDVLQEAYNAQRVDKISYGELHRFWRTALELKGKLHHDNSKHVNVGIFIDNS